MPAFEYRRATWDEVCTLGPQGWRLVPVPPIVEMRPVLGQVQAGEPMYAMEREISSYPAQAVQRPGLHPAALLPPS